MRRSLRSLLALLALCLPALGQSEKPPAPVLATIDSSLATATKGGHIRQLAFDGDAESYFLSEKNPTPSDHFTLVFEKPVAVKSIAITTGLPKGGEQLEAGSLEGSVDGKKFEPLAKFVDGGVSLKLDAKKLLAIRVKPTEEMKHPLAIREFVVESTPSVTVFKAPIEIKVDVTAAPELKEWAEKAARICEKQYPMICEELKSEGFKPRHEITIRMTNYDGVARAGGANIEGSAKYFKSHPDDFGAMVHETVHCVQAYRGRGNPGWLVEGVADYVRFFKYEPGTLRPLSPNQARYDGSYRVTAAFLGYLTDKHDKEIVRKLNAAMREGKYKEEIFKDLTGKTVKELETEWKESLQKR